MYIMQRSALCLNVCANLCVVVVGSWVYVNIYHICVQDPRFSTVLPVPYADNFIVAGVRLGNNFKTGPRVYFYISLMNGVC